MYVKSIVYIYNNRSSRGKLHLQLMDFPSYQGYTEGVTRHPKKGSTFFNLFSSEKKNGIETLQ